MFNEAFKHFYSYEWTYEIKNVIHILNQLSPEERILYNCNPRTLDLSVFIQLNCYGLQKFIFKEDVSVPHFETTSLINREIRNDAYFVFFQKG
mmetsp:Transcript_29854/g.29018  ORF Transcript_29854/g.29018 Transcript_29854/m.29018 type:complete len:93 (+) Transcript_29854:681-959(+)